MIRISHEGHAAAWEYVEAEHILRVKQFRHDENGEVVANYLHLQVDDVEQARRIAEPVVEILNDPKKISGMTESRHGGVMYVHRPSQAGKAGPAADAGTE
ncbi:MAG: hypothetical protein GIW99_10825 [Candidatus Eremiobacteraeota bacterium]|nr:hypothetical protein [Candidatus Eremiobacteraeota bacterium]MBC5828155.1 hypothetical protein [Candidatus Eremiobacteraeota bacterium]